jgi:hypothetical protein
MFQIDLYEAKWYVPNDWQEDNVVPVTVLDEHTIYAFFIAGSGK